MLIPPALPAASVAPNVSTKLPTFWPDAAQFWFAQADAQFPIKHVTVSKNKFYHALAVLPHEVAAQLLDLIRTPISPDPSEVLKERST